MYLFEIASFGSRYRSYLPEIASFGGRGKYQKKHYKFKWGRKLAIKAIESDQTKPKALSCHAMSTLMLDLLQNGSKHLRGTPAVSGNEHDFSTFDFINHTTGKSLDDTYGKTTFYRMKNSDEYGAEIKALTKMVKFPGQGQRETPTMTIRGLQRLLMMLGGKVAREYRELVEGTFTRVMAGDTSLIQVIEANAASNAPMQQAFRTALEQEPVAPVLEEICNVRKREREELEWEDRKAAVQQRRLQNIRSTMDILSMTADPRLPIDERTKLQMQDLAKNILFTNGSKTITNGDISENNPIDFQMLSNEMQVDCTPEDAKALGRLMAEKFRNTHMREPPKHMQWVGGKSIPVNSYMEKDREMMVEVITEYNSSKSQQPKARGKQPKALLPGQQTLSFQVPAGSHVIVQSPQ